MSRQLVPLRKINPDTHGIPFSPDMLNWVSFHREFNGAQKSGALVKCGGRVYVDPPKFLEWMATNQRISPPMKSTKVAKKATSPASRTPAPSKRRASPKPSRKPKPARARAEQVAAATA